MFALRLVLIIVFLAAIASMAAWAAGKQGAPPNVARTNNRSPVYRVPQSDVAFFMNYTGFAPADTPEGDGERFLKVQIEFNPDRVGNYKLLGFEKHRLKKEDFPSGFWLEP